MSPWSPGFERRLPSVPYCGAPPTPASLAGRWNLDFLLLEALALALVFYLGWSARPGSGVARWRRGAFCAGWALGALALVSPLCALSVSLFSARVGQHMLLISVVAPLIALGLPKPRCETQPVWAALAFGAALWVWHAPGPYAATFASDVVYWGMHLTTFGSALWLWRAVLDGERLAGRVAAIFLTTGQMGLLGAVITFAGRPLYAPHALTTYAWGLTPLEDQQLGGVVMWIPAGVLFAAGLTFAFTQVMRRAEARAYSRPAT